MHPFFFFIAYWLAALNETVLTALKYLPVPLADGAIMIGCLVSRKAFLVPLIGLLADHNFQ